MNTAVSLPWVNDGPDRQCLGRKAMVLLCEVEGVSRDGAMGYIACSGKRGVGSTGRVNFSNRCFSMLMSTTVFPTSKSEKRWRES